MKLFPLICPQVDRAALHELLKDYAGNNACQSLKGTSEHALFFDYLKRVGKGGAEHFNFAFGTVCEWTLIENLFILSGFRITYFEQDKKYYLIVSADLKEFLECVQIRCTDKHLRIFFNTVYLFLENKFPEIVMNFHKNPLPDGTFFLTSRGI